MCIWTNLEKALKREGNKKVMDLKNKKAVIVTCSHPKDVEKYWFNYIEHKGFNMCGIDLVYAGIKDGPSNWRIYEEKIKNNHFDLVVVQWHNDLHSNVVQKDEILKTLQSIAGKTLEHGGVVINLFESHTQKFGEELNGYLSGISPALLSSDGKKMHANMLNPNTEQRYYFQCNGIDYSNMELMAKSLNKGLIRGYSFLSKVDNHAQVHIQSNGHPILLSKPISNGCSIALAFGFNKAWNFEKTTGLSSFQNFIDEKIKAFLVNKERKQINNENSTLSLGDNNVREKAVNLLAKSEGLFKSFEKEVYDTTKMEQKEIEKEEHKKAQASWRDIVQRVSGKVSNDFKVIPHSWIIGQHLLQYFWFEIKHKDRINSASSVSLSVDKEQLKIYLEWNRQQSEKSVNSLEEHNRWIDFVHSWINDYSIDVSEFRVWVVNDHPKPITLDQFLNDPGKANSKIQQQKNNNAFSFRIGVMVPKKEFLSLENPEAKLVNWLAQLAGIYPYTSENFYADKLEKTVYKDIDAELTEENSQRLEGRVKHYFSKRYERDPINRKRALEIHGFSCQACGFNFGEVYGERGKDFIEIHHVKPLNTFEKAINIDPRRDLVPVCANCHRMIHRRKDDVLTIEQLRNLVNIKK